MTEKEIPETGTELICNPFIALIKAFDDPSDPHFGEILPRKCIMCYHRSELKGYVYGPGVKKKTDCTIDLPEDKHPKTLFGLNLEDHLPEILDGKEVGYYCPHFITVYEYLN